MRRTNSQRIESDSQEVVWCPLTPKLQNRHSNRQRRCSWWRKMSNSSRCGKCCQSICLGRATGFTKEQREYQDAIGCTVDKGFVLIQRNCPMLVWVWNGVTKNELVHDSNVTVANRDSGKIISKCLIHDQKPKICSRFCGSRYRNHTLYYVPDGCTMAGE